MNNLEREERRMLNERRKNQHYAFVLEEKTSPHRLCEKECIKLKSRISALESLLARAGGEMTFLCMHYEIPVFDKLIKEIDAILPATESKKDE